MVSATIKDINDAVQSIDLIPWRRLAVSRQNFPIYISSDYIMKEMIIHTINNNYKTKCKRSCCLGN